MAENIVLFILTGGGFGLLIFLLKKWLKTLEENQTQKLTAIETAQKKINGKVDGMVDAHHACRETLADRFADKKQTGENFSKLFDRVDEMGKDVSFIRGSIEGQKQ